ncbi:FAD-dependent oxidoreductase [Streptomyces sp. cg36]|uniref:FAD-dependent oxidoreductase n=1 Tax=Streptomyces sp. cg36 TaxID=3238798 RepID=UPI0034E2755A
MPAALVVGGSVAGLAAALALAGTGRQVVVLERSAPPPRGAMCDLHNRWQRPTVPQAQHSHTLTSLGVRTLRKRAPEVLERLVASGAPLFDLTRALPQGATDRAREVGDDDLVALGCRRTTLEMVLYRAVAALPQVDIRHGTTVRGLRLGPDGRAVRGVVTTDGAHLAADVVVDATGRRAAARGWLTEAGIPVEADETSPSGLRGFSRFYRLRSGSLPGPLNRGHAAGDIWDHYAGVLHPADAGTFSIALGTLPGDPALAGLRDPDAFTAAARATPGLTEWLDESVSAPHSAVHVITSPANSLRATALRPPVAGLFPVGDAACVTDPLFGRGMSLALAQAFGLADVLAARPAEQWRDAAADFAETLLRPWYEHAADADRERIARWNAMVYRRPLSPAAPGQAVRATAAHDGTVWRGLTRVLMGLATPDEVFGDEKFRHRVAQAPQGAVATGAAPPPRDELVRAVAAAEGERP